MLLMYNIHTFSNYDALRHAQATEHTSSHPNQYRNDKSQLLGLTEPFLSRAHPPQNKTHLTHIYSVSVVFLG